MISSKGALLPKQRRHGQDQHAACGEFQDFLKDRCFIRRYEIEGHGACEHAHSHSQTEFESP
ncbi:hypothetical protein AM571_PC02004 (plasmid) [Rhizobium etli 8C-3]|uniref:Uncharacterized protein n=2 Tax=Rhizobium TaxID=379 RepID=A0A1L5PHR6_RHIET|nr:hypothetical protein AM571_PC02004 [Rhizobium etli 8C-3]TCU30529.1 hypothetical protein EV130_101100 [Rhizobium azibense]